MSCLFDVKEFFWQQCLRLLMAQWCTEQSVHLELLEKSVSLFLHKNDLKTCCGAGLVHWVEQATHTTNTEQRFKSTLRLFTAFSLVFLYTHLLGGFLKSPIKVIKQKNYLWLLFYPGKRLNNTHLWGKESIKVVADLISCIKCDLLQ